MKYLMYISILLFGMLGASSCTQDETMEQNGSDMFTLKVNMGGTKKATRATDGIAPESNEGVMSNLYIFFYEKDGDNSLKVSCLETDLGTSTSDWSKKIEKSKFEEGKIYDVYALANVSSDVADQLVENISKDVLTAITENLMARTASEPKISFSTYTVGTFSLAALTTDNTHTIPLTRTVARLDMIIDTTAVKDNWILESVKVSNELTSTKYFSDVTHTPARSTEDKDAFVSGDNKKYYYYVYEDQSDAIGLTFNLVSKADHSKTRTYTAKVPKSITRNTVYTLNVTLEDQVENPVTITCSMGVWKPVDVGVNVPNFYLDLPSDTIELSNIGSGELYFKSNAESVTVTWKDNNNLLVNSSRGPSKVINPTDTLGNYKIDFFMLPAVQTATKDIITLSVGNLVKEVVAIKPASDYSFNIFISPMDEHPDEIKTYNYKTDKNIEIEINSEISNVIKPWYYITVLGRLNENGSLDEKKLLGIGGAYLSNGTLTLNMMQEISGYMDASFNKGIFLVEIAIGYGEPLGSSPVYRSAKYYIENLN